MSEGSDKLARSRQAIIEHIARKQRKHDPRETREARDYDQGFDDFAQQDEPAPQGAGWFARLSHGIKVWWRYHPANMVAELASPLVRGYARRKPMQLLS